MHAVKNRFVLPIGALIATMQTSFERVVLQAHLSSLPGVSKQACLAHIVVGEGRIHACTIFHAQTGALLRQEHEAYKSLEALGDLEWTILPYQPAPHEESIMTHLPHPSTPPVPSQASLIPQRKHQPEPNIIASLHPAYRKLLLLVDGKRSVERIAQLLSKSPEDVFNMLLAMPSLIELPTIAQQER
jgi:hypothetical protein